MITQAKIDEIFGSKMAAAVGIKFRLANQKGKKPARPYATYNPGPEDVESLHQNYREVAVNSGDSTLADVSKWEASRMTVSLRFIGDKNSHIDTLRAKANAAINWIRWNKVDGVVLRVLNPAVLDLTEFVEQNYQHVLAVDIRVDSSEEHTQTVEALKTTVMGRTEDGDVLSDVIVREP